MYRTIKKKGGKMTQLKIKGEHLVEGLNTWFKKELVDGISSSTDLGKFFFSVSSASIGIVLTLYKIGNIQLVSFVLVLGLLIYLCSIFVSIFLVYPRIFILNEETDLFVEYKKHYKKIRVCLLLWFFLWFLGTLFSIISLLNI